MTLIEELEALHAETHVLTPVEIARLRRLANLSDEEIVALADVGKGVVTAGRIRYVVVYIMAAIGVVVTTITAAIHLWSFWKSGSLSGGL